MSVPLRPPGTFGKDDPGDPAYWMLSAGHTSTPKVFRKGCYICEDPQFAQMGMPLCNPCNPCSERLGIVGSGHMAADSLICDDCGHECHPECGCYPDV